MSKKMKKLVSKCIEAGLPVFIPEPGTPERNECVVNLYRAVAGALVAEFEKSHSLGSVEDLFLNYTTCTCDSCAEHAKALNKEAAYFANKQLGGKSFTCALVKTLDAVAEQHGMSDWERRTGQALTVDGLNARDIEFRIEWVRACETAFLCRVGEAPPEEVLVATKPRPEPQPQPFGLSGVMVSKFVDKLAANGLPLWVPEPGAYEFNTAVLVMYDVARDTLGEDVRQWRTGDIVNALGEPGTLELRKSVEGWWRGECYSSFVGAIQRVNWVAPPAASEEVLLKALRANNDGTNKAVTKTHNMFRYFWVAKMEEAFKAKLAAVVPAMPAATASEPTKRYARILDGGLAGWHTTVVFEYDSLVECFGLTEHMWKCTFTRCDAVGGEVTKSMVLRSPHAPGEFDVTAMLCSMFNLAATHSCSDNLTRLPAEEWEAVISLRGASPLNVLDIPPAGTAGSGFMYNLSGELYEVIAGTIGFPELLTLIGKENVK